MSKVNPARGFHAKCLLPMRGSISPPLRGLPFSSLTSGNSILATEYAFCRDQQAGAIFSSGESSRREAGLPNVFGTAFSRSSTYDVFRAENSELNFLHRANRRIGLCKWHDLLRSVETRQSQHKQSCLFRHLSPRDGLSQTMLRWSSSDQAGRRWLTEET